MNAAAPAACFSCSYAEARTAFLSAAAAAGAELRSHRHPLAGSGVQTFLLRDGVAARLPDGKPRGSSSTRPPCAPSPLANPRSAASASTSSTRTERRRRPTAPSA